MAKLKYEITSDHPCQIPVLGEFAAGETKVLNEYTLELFRRQFGYEAAAGRYAPSVRFVTTTVTETTEEPAVEETVAEEKDEEV